MEQKKANIANFTKVGMAAYGLISVYMNWLHVVCFGPENILCIFFAKKKKHKQLFASMEFFSAIKLMNTLKRIRNNTKKSINITILQVEVIACWLLLHLPVPQPVH